MANDATIILLIRHGETEWNAAGRIQGQTNSNLTERGLQQAHAVARWTCANVPPTAVWPNPPTALYASDLDRTVQTAQPIADSLNIKMRLDSGLREIHFGELEGLTWEEAEARFPNLGSKLWDRAFDPNARPPGGESRMEMLHRARSAITSIAEKHPKETISIVSHGGVINFFIRDILNIPLDSPPTFRITNGSISVIRYKSGDFKLVSLGLVPS